MLLHKELSEAVIAAAIEVHRVLGPGLLESCYEQCLCHELKLRGIAFRKRADLPIEDKGVKLDCGYRIDLVIEEKIVVEIKAVEELHPIHEAQLLTYLRLSGIRVGLILNFHAPVMKDGIVRRVL